MDDISIAKTNLNGYTLVLCKGGKKLSSNKRGIAQMVEYLRADIDLRGYSAADMIVGKAVASMFVLAGVDSVFAKTISKKGLEYLENHGVRVEYDVLTDCIVNRQGNDVCPMERAVENIDEPEKCFEAILKKIEETR